MREAKSITVRWAEAKARVLVQQSRIDAICYAVAKDVRDTCGQTVTEAEIHVDGHTFPLESDWGRAKLNYQFPGADQYTPYIKAGVHWAIGLSACEKLADAMEKVTPEQIRLAYEATL